MDRNIIAVVGSKSSGKTKTIEILTKELTKKGYKIAAAKHIPEPNFTIDKKGKDTWRFAQSGAIIILSVASNEIATIERTERKCLSLKNILQKCRNVDLVFLEGFRKLVGKNIEIPKIVVIKSGEEAFEAIKIFRPILVFTSLRFIENLNLDVPYINLLKDREKIVRKVENECQKRAGD